MAADYVKIAAEVGDWSRRNFGGQESKATPGLVLGPLAPLLGLVEELGEYFAARPVYMPGAVEAREDAIGDMLIYMLDFVSRAGVALDLQPLHAKRREATQEVAVAAIGRLVHVVLKRHQGIRGMSDDGAYASALREAANAAFAAVCGLSPSPGDVLDETWQGVSARDWKASPNGPQE